VLHEGSLFPMLNWLKLDNRILSTGQRRALIPTYEREQRTSVCHVLVVLLYMSTMLVPVGADCYENYILELDFSAWPLRSSQTRLSLPLCTIHSLPVFP